MNHLSKKLSFLAISITLLIGCSAVQLPQPEGKAKPGAVGLAFYAVKISPEGERQVMKNIRFHGIYLDVLEGKTWKSIDLDPKQTLYLRSHVVLTGLNPNKTYALRYIEFEQKSGKTYYQYSLPLNPNQTVKTAPIQFKKGRINFIGIKAVEIKEKSTFLGVNTQPVKVRLSNDWKTLANANEDGIYGTYATWAKQDVFGFEKDHTPKGSKKYLLQKIVKTQEKGYWKELAEKNLK